MTLGESPVRPTNSDIAAHALFLQKEGYRTSTIESQVSSLKTVARHSNIYNPDSVKTYLARLNVTEARKEALVIRLNRFYRWKKIQWTPPRYRRVEKLPFIPLESEIDQIFKLGYPFELSLLSVQREYQRLNSNLPELYFHRTLTLNVTVLSPVIWLCWLRQELRELI